MTSSAAVNTLVLARKYRPRNFSQMVGQEHVVRALSNALATRRLHHAYLFTGTRGIGKTTVSRILAKSLNCTGADGSGDVTAEPCGVCGACREIDADRFIDYIELDAASNRGIDEARDLIERAAYKPSVGRYKVFMIDEAHQLTKDAFNALLKTLEEPPEYLKFVLATTDPEKMLPTVLSRCLQFNLRPMAPELVRKHLATVLRAEGLATDAGSLQLISRAARGSMRDALSLTDQAIAFGGGRLEEAVVRSMLGSVDRSHAAALVRALARRDGVAVLGTIDALREHGLSAAGTLDELATLLQRMAVAQAVPSPAADRPAADADEDDDDDRVAVELAAAMPADETQLLYSIALHGRSELSLMDDEYAALTMVLLRIFAFAPGGAASSSVPGTVAVPAASAPKSSPPAPAVPARAAPLRAASPPALKVAAVSVPPSSVTTPVLVGEGANDVAVAASSAGDLDRWCHLARELDARGAIQALVRELAWQAGVIAHATNSAGEECWRLVVESATLRGDGVADKLAAALSALRGAAVRLEIDAAAPGDSLARREAAERARMQARAEETIRNDPVVVELMQQFATARIVPGSIKPIAPQPSPEGSPT